LYLNSPKFRILNRHLKPISLTKMILKMILCFWGLVLSSSNKANFHFFLSYLSFIHVKIFSLCLSFFFPSRIRTAALLFFFFLTLTQSVLINSSLEIKIKRICCRKMRYLRYWIYSVTKFWIG